MERDVRRTSADPDENDLLHEALNRLTTLLSTLLTQTLGMQMKKKKNVFDCRVGVLDELLSSTDQTRKASPAKDTFKKWLASFRLISTIIGNHVRVPSSLLPIEHLFSFIPVHSFSCGDTDVPEETLQTYLEHQTAH